MIKCQLLVREHDAAAHRARCVDGRAHQLPAQPGVGGVEAFGAGRVAPPVAPDGGW
jgi:hypothetical protein